MAPLLAVSSYGTCTIVFYFFSRTFAALTLLLYTALCFFLLYVPREAGVFPPMCTGLRGWLDGVATGAPERGARTQVRLGMDGRVARPRVSAVACPPRALSVLGSAV